MKLELDNISVELKKSITFNEDLSKYSWFNLGGPSQVFFRPDNLKQLSEFLIKKGNIFKKISILGAGSNTLIRDGGISGLTIKLSSKFSYLNLIDDNIIEAGASTLDKKVSNFAAENSLAGFEFLSCIPGTIGGAIMMNSGCYNQEISDILISFNVVDLNGKMKEIKKNEIEFFYRGNNLPNDYVITSAKFKGIQSKKEEIILKKNKFTDQKKNNQPSQVKTCGSTFKNPANKKAWQLIKNAKCENLFVGGAKISKKHCNFFINEGKATAANIEELIEKVKKQVFDKSGIKLELEIKIVGNKNQ